MLICRASAQSDEDVYNYLYSQRLARGINAANDLASEQQQQADDQAAVAADQSTVDSLNQQVQADDQASAAAGPPLQSAHITLQSDQATLSGLQNQLSSAASSVSADADQYDEDWNEAMDDADEYQELTDEAGDDPDNTDFYLLEASIALSDEFDAEARMQTDYVQYLTDLAPEQALVAQVNAAQSQVSSDQQVLSNAQSAMDYAQAQLAVDSASLGAAIAQQNSDNLDLQSVEAQIQGNEDIVLAESAWTTANSSFGAWVANGEPN